MGLNVFMGIKIEETLLKITRAEQQQETQVSYVAYGTLFVVVLIL